MTSERIKEIQEQTAYPESLSVKQALLQVWNECQQEHNKQLRLHGVVSTCCDDKETALKNKIRLADIDRCAK